MKINRPVLRFYLSLPLALALGGTQANAADRTWGNTGTDFATGANWVGGTAPANDTTSDRGLFTAATATNNPEFTANRSINGLQFDPGTAAWTFTGSGGTRTLSLGSGGIINSSTSTQTFSSTVQLAVNGSTTFDADSGDLAINSAVNLTNPGSSNLELTGTSGVGIGTLSGVVSGNQASIQKYGPGTWTLTAANTFNESYVYVSEGTLKIQNSYALGTVGTQNSTYVSWTGAIELQNNINVYGSEGSSDSPGLTLVSGGTLRSVSGTNTYNGRIVGGDGYGVDINGVTVGGVLEVAAGGELILPGILSANLSENAHFTKSGAGTLTLSGTGNQVGKLALNEGVIQVSASGNLGTDARLQFDGGTLRSTATMAIAPTGVPINIGSNGGTIDVVANTTLTYADSMTGTGTLTKTGAGTFSVGQTANAYRFSIGSNGVQTNSFDSASFYNFDQLTPGRTFNGTVTSSFGPANSMSLSNAYVASRGTGDLGTPPVYDSGAGFGPGGATMTNPNDTPWLKAGTITMTLNQAVGYFGVLYGNIETASSFTFRDATNAILFTISGSDIDTYYSGSHFINVNSLIPIKSVIIERNGGTPLEFDNIAIATNADSIAGGSVPVNVLEGEFKVINNGFFNTVGSTDAVQVASGATLRFDGSTNVTQQNIGTLSGAGTVINSGSNALSLRINATSNSTFSGLITDTTNSLSLVKLGSATQTLTGNNTYTGPTTVTAGQLTVDGSSASSAHTVGNGGTLGGSGTVGALVVQSGGTIAPGTGPDILDVSGNTTWQGGGNYNWQLLDATSGWDQLAINGALDLAGLTSENPFKVNVWSLSSALVNGNALNFDGSGGIYSWPIATASGGITGFNASNFFINTAPVNGTTGFTNDFTGGTFSMSQTGNNLYLNYLGPTPVPEPANAVTVLALFSGAVLQRRKRVVRH